MSMMVMMAGAAGGHGCGEVLPSRVVAVPFRRARVERREPRDRPGGARRLTRRDFSQTLARGVPGRSAEASLRESLAAPAGLDPRSLPRRLDLAFGFKA